MQNSITSYLDPISNIVKNRQVLGGSMVEPNFNDFNFNVAIIGVGEDGNAPNNKGCAQSPNAIREKLYNFESPFNTLKIADLGNIKRGAGLNDSYAALRYVVSELNAKGVVTIIIGGSHDLTLPAFQGLSDNRNDINISLLDAYCDYSENADFDNRTYLSQFVNTQKLNSICLIGNQNFCSNVTPFREVSNSLFANLRIGELRGAFHRAEPFLRDSDFVSVDLGVVRYSDNPASGNGLPTGLYAEELCQLTRYAGFSDRISLFGLFETNSTHDLHGISATLAAQAIWFFLDGLNGRYKDFPIKSLDKYQKNIVHQPDTDSDFIFYHNQENNRWWYLINGIDHDKIISCAYEDYVEVTKGNIPDRLMFG